MDLPSFVWDLKNKAILCAWHCILLPRATSVSLCGFAFKVF